MLSPFSKPHRHVGAGMGTQLPDRLAVRVEPCILQRYDDLRPDVPTGIRARIYTGGTAENEGNLSPEGYRLYMNEGTHDLLFYNNDTEYIVFNDIAALASASATTRSPTRGFRSPARGERTVNQPDMLYGAYIGSYDTCPRRRLSVCPCVCSRSPIPTSCATSSNRVSVRTRTRSIGRHTESVYLNDGHTGPEAATVMFDCTLRDYGPDTTVKSFGISRLPRRPLRRRHPHHGTLLPPQSRSASAQRRDEDLRVRCDGPSEYQPRGGVDYRLRLPCHHRRGRCGIPDSGFDIDVEGWGDYIDIPCHCKKGDLYKTDVLITK